MDSFEVFTVTALVTGGTGFVGSHLARQLVARGERIRALVRPNSRRDNLADLDARRVDFVCGDLTDPDSLREAVRGCDLLYHVAADYRLWARDPQELYRANVDGTRHLLQAALDAGVSKVVYTSTVGALGLPKDGTPGTEETPVSEADMIGHYKRSKFLAEQEARQFTEKGLPVVIVNPSTPVGENDIKPTPTGQVIVDFLNRRLPAYIYTGLNLIDVRDVAEGMLLAAERGRVGERYILGNQNITLKEILELLADITGMPAPKARMPYAVAWLAVGVENIIAERLLHRAPAHPFEGVKMARHKMFFDASKAVRELGLPQSPIREALARAVAWFREHGYVTNKS
ncbi:MAG TPA: hopanoid-associated sugar epimerase [Chthonomonadaceae bacterium]|nr:hopanoid-associated sugar epimerase [Chthonomonadaceae bacterium]